MEEKDIPKAQPGILFIIYKPPKCQAPTKKEKKDKYPNVKLEPDSVALSATRPLGVVQPTGRRNKGVTTLRKIQKGQKVERKKTRRKTKCGRQKSKTKMAFVRVAPCGHYGCMRMCECMCVCVCEWV